MSELPLWKKVGIHKPKSVMSCTPTLQTRGESDATDSPTLTPRIDDKETDRVEARAIYLRSLFNYRRSKKSKRSVDFGNGSPESEETKDNAIQHGRGLARLNSLQREPAVGPLSRKTMLSQFDGSHTTPYSGVMTFKESEYFWELATKHKGSN